MNLEWALCVEAERDSESKKKEAGSSAKGERPGLVSMV